MTNLNDQIGKINEQIKQLQNKKKTLLAKDISQLIRKTYGGNIKVFKTEIPLSVKAAETSAVGKSIYSYDKNGRVADAYRNLTKEVMNNEQRTKHKSEIIR